MKKVIDRGKKSKEVKPVENIGKNLQFSRYKSSTKRSLFLT